AAGTAATARARLKAVITHATRSIDTSNDDRRSGSARTTTDESANTVATAIARPRLSGNDLTPRMVRARSALSHLLAIDRDVPPAGERPARPPADLAEQRVERGDEQRPHDERVEQDPDRHRERELTEGTHRGDGEQAEAGGERDAGGAHGRGRP